ncbi:MAG: TolC family protein [Candidatus Methylacidiphilales bacterium]
MPAAAENVTIASIPERIRTTNPSLVAARLRVEEARGRFQGAGRLSNPSLGIEMKHDRKFEEGTLPLSFDQSFPITARLRLEKVLSHKGILAAELEIRDTERRLVAEAQTIAVKLVSVAQQRELRKQQAGLSANLAQFATKRAEMGEISALDAAQAQVDSKRMLLEINQLEVERVVLTGELRLKLGSVSDTPLVVVGGMSTPIVTARAVPSVPKTSGPDSYVPGAYVPPASVPRSTSAPYIPGSANARSTGPRVYASGDFVAKSAPTKAYGPEYRDPRVTYGPVLRPDYLRAKLAEDAALTEVELAKARKWSDVTAGVFVEGERSRDEPEGLDDTVYMGFRLSVPLPLWNQNKGEVREKLAAAQRAALETRALVVDISNEAGAAKSEMAANAQLSNEIREKLMPLVVQQTDRLEQAYKKGEVDMLTVLRSRDQRLSLESAVLDATRNYHLARIRYESATGRNVGMR